MGSPGEVWGKCHLCSFRDPKVLLLPVDPLRGQSVPPSDAAFNFLELETPRVLDVESHLRSGAN